MHFVGFCQFLPVKIGFYQQKFATRNDIVDISSSTMAFNVAKIASSARLLTISLRVAGPYIHVRKLWKCTTQ